MTYLATTRDGRFLMSASYDNACLVVHRINADGTVGADSVQVIETPPKAHCIIQSPRDDVVVACSITGNAILSFRLEADSGRLEPLAEHRLVSWPHAGPRHLDFHPTLQVLYSINEHAGSVLALAIQSPDETLHELQCETIVPPGFSGNARAGDIHVTPDGRLLYASVRDSGSIWAFKIAPDSGRLEPAGTFTVDLQPRGFAIDPGGRFLVCAGEASDSVSIYAIEPATGSLRRQASIPVGQRPSWIEILAIS